MRGFVGGLWLASAVLPAVALVTLHRYEQRSVLLMCFALFVPLETGHSLSPIVLAWTHAAFRRQMIYAHLQKFVLLPAAVFAAALSIGIATQVEAIPYRGQLAPISLLVSSYLIWNIFHFGMQNFGVLRLMGSQRHWIVDAALCVSASIFAMAFLPYLVPDDLWVAFLMTGIISVNHWVVDIGLSSRVARCRWAFIVGLILAGMVGFIWMVPTSRGMMVRMIPVIICARMGLGFVHFLYSRWVWKLGDPLVRATIGADLFRETSPAAYRSASG